MGEAKRRKAEIEKLKRESPKAVACTKAIKLSVDAIHEAGHAVGRFLTVEHMGFSEADAVAFIDMRKIPPSQDAIRGGDAYGRGAITYGPMFSRTINAVTDPKANASMIEIINAARDQGVDVYPWALAKTLIAVAGPAAEAKAAGKSFDAMWEARECANDFAMAMETCLAIGLSDTDAVSKIDLAAENIMENFSIPPIWNALLHLAAALPPEGIMTGADAWAIYSRARDGIAF